MTIDKSSAERGRRPDMEWKGVRVLVTGHTGFMGGWLTLWLAHRGASVFGYSLAPPTSPSLFETAAVQKVVKAQEIADIRNLESLTAAVSAWQPEIVFHLAAQPLVRHAFRDPVATFDTNVMGTVNVLEALRTVPSLKGIVIVTSDKVYDNVEWEWAYRENDRLGGHEPYGVSKACAELAIEAYRHSYFRQRNIGIATVRAGNIIGGGDWAEDRLIPDIVRAFSRTQPVIIRNPHSTRPWQHVIEPVAGYFTLAAAVVSDPDRFSGGWNFGPKEDDHKSVEWIVDACARYWGAGATWKRDSAVNPYEAKRLGVTYAKAENQLAWKPVFRLDQALGLAIDWYRAHERGDDMYRHSIGDIEKYCAASSS